MGSVVLLQHLAKGIPSRCLLHHLDKEIPFKVSVFFVVLLQHLDKEIPFKVSVSSVVLLQHLDKEIPFKVSVGSVVLLQHIDKEISFKVSVGSVVLLQHLDKEVPFRVSVPWSIVAQGPLGSRVSDKVRKGTPGALLRKVRLDPGSPKRSDKVPLEHCCARSAWIQGLRKGPKRYPWRIVAQGPLGSRVSEKVRKGTPGALLRKVCLDPGSPKRSDKVPLQHCCSRSAWIQGLRKGPKRYPWSIVAQGPLGSRVSEKVRKGTPEPLLRKVRLDPGSPKRSEKAPLEHCCARSAWIQGLRKGPKRYPWSIVVQGPLGSRVSEKVRKGTPGALLRKVRLDPGSPKRYEKVPLEHCCARSAWIQGLRKGPKRYPWSIVAQGPLG